MTPEILALTDSLETLVKFRLMPGQYYHLAKLNHYCRYEFSTIMSR